jgi:hypothetical protein
MTCEVCTTKREVPPPRPPAAVSASVAEGAGGGASSGGLGPAPLPSPTDDLRTISNHEHPVKLCNRGGWSCDGGCGTTTSGRFRCDYGCDFDLCGKCVRENEVHRVSNHVHPVMLCNRGGWSCDGGCGTTTSGRFRCDYGCDFDLCGKCVRKMAHSTHSRIGDAELAIALALSRAETTATPIAPTTTTTTTTITTSGSTEGDASTTDPPAYTAVTTISAPPGTTAPVSPQPPFEFAISGVADSEPVSYFVEYYEGGKPSQSAGKPRFVRVNDDGKVLVFEQNLALMDGIGSHELWCSSQHTGDPRAHPTGVLLSYQPTLNTISQH